MTRKTCAIFFTPRSGSSWLTELISSTERLGRPEEWFNSAFIPDISAVLGVDGTKSDYIDTVMATQSVGGWFSFEITYFQLIEFFGTEEDYIARFGGADVVIELVRRDVVSQGISLAKAVETGVFHSPSSRKSDLERADTAFKYNGTQIREWVDHIVQQEEGQARLFRSLGGHPTRIYYEDVIGSAEKALAKLADCSGIHFDAYRSELEHSKIGTSQNALYRDRFIEEERAFVSEVTSRRALIGIVDRWLTS